MLLLSKLLMLTVASNGDVSHCVCIFNFETVSSLYRALYEVRLCIPNILDGIKLHHGPTAPRLHNRNIAKFALHHLLASSARKEQDRFNFSNEIMNEIIFYGCYSCKTSRI